MRRNGNTMNGTRPKISEYGKNINETGGNGLRPSGYLLMDELLVDLMVAAMMTITVEVLPHQLPYHNHDPYLLGY